MRRSTSADRFCHGFHRSLASRRQVLQAGVLGAGGLTLPGLWQARRAAGEAGPGGGFGRARRCIFLFMWGGPSQLDTFDPKPLAESEVRGEFHAISTQTPGLALCEHFRNLAMRTDRVAIIRSLSHDDPAHLSSGHTTYTGHLPPVNKSDAEPPSERDTPHFGCVMSHLRPADRVLPSFVMMPWKVLHPAAPGGVAPGQHGGWLGQKYNPLIVTGDPNRPDWRVPSLALTAGITYRRMAERRELLQQLDAARMQLDCEAIAQTDHLQQRAYELLASDRIRKAFDLRREPDAVRHRFGRNIHGQSVLLARRLVEQGVPVVTVNWHQDHRNFWDTHGNNFQRLKSDLIPPADQALSALLDDLTDRGLLEETLVVWVGEFGRKPLITPGNAGREHWPYCYSGLLAGGGIRGGAVYGESDRHAAYPVRQAVSPQDLMATVYYALGVPEKTTLLDQEGRPRRVYAGEPIRELFG